MAKTTYPLTPGQLRTVCGWAKEYDKTGRDRTLFLFAAHCALRISDILRLKYEDVFYPDAVKQIRFRDYVKVKERKTGKTRRFKVSDRIRGDMKWYVKKNKIGPGMWLFFSFRDQSKPLDRTNAWRVCHKCTEETGIVTAPHSFRKTFGRTLVEYSKNPKFTISKLQMVYGHRSQKETIKYLGFLQEEIDEMTEEVANIYDLPPWDATT